jgi:hypothetical protein
MDETKRVFTIKEIEENGVGFIIECLKNLNLKEINFYGK